MEFVEISEAKERTGLRLVTVAGVPSPWSEAAKGIFHVKKLPCALARMKPNDAEVLEWTGSPSAPIAIYESEAPRTGWAEILLLAERLAPEPALLPRDPAERALAMGIAHEICGEMGLGWCRRLAGVASALEPDGDPGYPEPVAHYLGAKYGFRPGCGPEVRQRVLDLLGMLGARLRAQRDAGSRYLMGASLTAVDIYSATFAFLFAALDPRDCPLPDPVRAFFSAIGDEVAGAIDPLWIEHRDFIYREHLELPVQL